MPPLTPKQRAIWGMLRLGLSANDIAERLESSRQYVHQVSLIAEAKISKTLLAVAQTAQLQIRRMDAPNGILLAYDPARQAQVIITYTTKNGVRIWDWHSRIEDIQDVSHMAEVRAYLLNEAEERGLPLTAKEKELHPAKLAQLIFSRLVPGLTA
jgi:hypothetical protein